jgi:phosphatidate cytidylyltransferase
LIVVKAGDTGAFTVGKLIGRNKLAPALSPRKTVEGAFGALAFAAIAAWITFTWLLPWIAKSHERSTPWWAWLAFGLLVGAAGMLGDLAESLMKRDVGTKDSSTWLPGLGGVLDVIDSVLLAAPAAWFFWTSRVVGP